MDKRKSSGKQIAAVVLIAAGFISAVFGVFGLFNVGMDPYESRKGIVFIAAIAQDNAGNMAGGTGTGWAIGKRGEPVEYIVTNGHVVEAAYTYPKMYPGEVSGLVQVYFSAAENDFVQAKVVYYSGPSEKDLAILQLPSPTDKRTALSIRPSDTVKVGENAYALGYPGNASINNDFSTYDENDITMTKGIISKETTLTSSTYKAFQMDVSIASGNSGGPLVDEKGNVIGINVATAYDVTTGQLSDVHYAIIADELTRILDSERIAYTLSGSGLSWAQPWFAYVFLPLGILLLAGGITLIVINSRKSRMMPENATPFAKKGFPKGSGPMRKRAVLRGVTGKYSGYSFDLIKGKVVIGRDPATCNIVFEKDTPGISGRHCQVVYSENEDCFLITDLGSSYGTYLGNGKKLTANVAEKLYAGDTFYLCDNANRFVVTKE